MTNASSARVLINTQEQRPYFASTTELANYLMHNGRPGGLYNLEYSAIPHLCNAIIGDLNKAVPLSIIKKRDLSNIILETSYSLSWVYIPAPGYNEVLRTRTDLNNDGHPDTIYKVGQMFGGELEYGLYENVPVENESSGISARRLNEIARNQINIFDKSVLDDDIPDILQRLIDVVKIKDNDLILVAPRLITITPPTVFVTKITHDAPRLICKFSVSPAYLKH